MVCAHKRLTHTSFPTNTISIDLHGKFTITAHCLHTLVVPLDTEHWYIPESVSNIEGMLRNGPEIKVCELLVRAVPSLYQLSVISKET